MAERFAEDGYKIIQSVEINGMEIVIADNPQAEKPYLMTRRSLDETFGVEDYIIPVYSSDYPDILRQFVECQSACVDTLSLERAYRGSAVVDAPLRAGDCVPNGLDMDLEGRVVALKASILRPEYRACSHQLVLATGGFGCASEARGRAVYTTNLYSGEQERWDRGDILGVIAEDRLPGWAHEKLAKLRQPREKESVISKIREAKNNPSAPKEGQRQKKNHEPNL